MNTITKSGARGAILGCDILWLGAHCTAMEAAVLRKTHIQGGVYLRPTVRRLSGHGSGPLAYRNPIEYQEGGNPKPSLEHSNVALIERRCWLFLIKLGAQLQCT